GPAGSGDRDRRRRRPAAGRDREPGNRDREALTRGSRVGLVSLRDRGLSLAVCRTRRTAARRRWILMPFQLPPLPYPYDGLAPHISAQTLQIHHDKHHAGYIKKLNELVGDDASLAGKGLDDLVRQARGTVYEQAAQAWNHDFYWRSMRPQGGGAPVGAI